MLRTLTKQLKSYPASRYLIGFSGGRDSHVLLDLCCDLRDQGLTVPMTAIHVNHNLNDKSQEWVEHCQAICDAYRMTLIVETVTDRPKSGESLEAFARDARYRLIEKHLRKGDVFLSAHHQRDQAETFLLQLMRGAGLDGLRAMPVIRDLGEGRYLRPLLDVEYADVTTHAIEKKLNYIEDDSNADTRFDRNYLRHEVLPVLAKRFPKVNANIAQSAKWLAEIPDVVTPKNLLINDLLSDSKETQKQSIRAFVKSKTGHALLKTQTQYILAHHLNAAADKHPVLAIGEYVVRRYDGELIVTQKLPAMPELQLSVDVGSPITVSPVATLKWQRGHGVNYDGALTIKPLRGGERFHPHTRSYATTIKKLLNEARIPVWLRPYYVGLYLDNELLAIPGVGVCKKHYQKSENAQMPLWIIDDKFVRM